MDCIKKKVNEELAAGWIGSNKACAYHPCHFTGQDCTFCYCPFYPCNDTTFGNELTGKRGNKVWACSDCLFIHRPEVGKFVIARAKELLTALDRRKTTLEKLGDVIVATQRDFLEHGKKALHPLTMKHAGELMHVDESVVSRAAADKLVATPQGVFPCRYFFSSGFPPAAAGGGDGGVSSRAVMERIRELIADEDPAKPLSDNDLAALLKKEGTPVARRTVAKYRDLAKIPAASLRRRSW